MGMEKGAEKATMLIEYAGEKQRAKTEPTTEDAKVYMPMVERRYVCKYIGDGAHRNHTY